MFNKLKKNIIKNTLEKREKLIFESICNNNPNINFSKAKDLTLDYADSYIVKTHHLGEIFKDKNLKNILLSGNELALLNEGYNILNELQEYHKEIVNNGYKILCSTELMEQMFFKSATVKDVKKAISILNKELDIVKRDFDRISKVNKEESSKDVLFFNNLNEYQKEDLSKLGVDYEENESITFAKLKEVYRKCLYSNRVYSAEEANSYNPQELSKAFFNLKKSFVNNY